MVLNVEQITNRLAQMPDAALQKYAAMNKNDPYIMALAVSESNRRKQMRQAAQGAQGQMPQPKVVDAAVQNMAAPMPEDMGIARLPAGDMNFADGGIVAFADGGDVERYNGATGSLTGDIQKILQKSPYERTPQDNAMLMQAGYNVQSRTLGPDSSVAGVNEFLQGLGPRMRNYFTGGASRLSDEELAARPAVGGVATERVLRGLGAEQATIPLGPQASYSNEGRREPGLFAAAPAAPAATLGGRPLGDKTIKTSAGAETGVAAGTRPQGSASLEALYKRLQPSDADYAAADTARTAVAERMQMLGKQNLSDFEADEAKRGDPLKGREERLAKREGEFAGMKDKNLGLALLQAGAAMMSTPGSLGVALGKGVDVGAKQYAAGIDKINAAQERLLEARDKLDELRMNRDDMTAKERRQLKSQASQLEVQAQQLFLDGAEKKLGYKRDDATKLFSGVVTLLGQETAAAPQHERNRLYRDAQAGEAKLRSDYGKLQAKVMDTLSKDDSYKMARPEEQARMYNAAMRQALQANPFLAQYAGDIGFMRTPSGPVYDLTD